MREKLALETRNEAEVSTQALFGPPYAFQFAVASVADGATKEKLVVMTPISAVIISSCNRSKIIEFLPKLPTSF